MTAARDAGLAADDEIITWWGLVIEGYHATQARIQAEIGERFDLAPASFDILIRLVRSPDHRMPMTRLAHEAALSSGGFTKVADRLVAADLIRRHRCDRDRRVTYAELTDHGLDIAKQVRAAGAEILRRRVLAPLGPGDSQRLADAMRALREANGDPQEERGVGRPGAC
ncbi:MarR family winged helix-turn-helix transcriptional regulator [Actinoalloteichus caeruleus]|uniref:DNA-binding transcriptional regulator, MarR family n=1 Tax=Actinoalloteichus caeruleus DSM 43889 TaxID=1120930 RepID=A0ABT1JB78_ACTCY|nr:MarR family winged helix-turn-helix transcriptional regulator [Actinoalloteichus caeruleus]MCP2329752.1 DNA-binding transcriptional regulator, MarR family [Actinoalloteichus caeruleus DSM 43889]